MRILTGQCLRRERMKRDILFNNVRRFDLLAFPLSALLMPLLEHMSRKDGDRIFAQPVEISDAPGYYDIILQPIDLATMHAKILRHEYVSFFSFVADVQLLTSNALRYFNLNTHPYPSPFIFTPTLTPYPPYPNPYHYPPSPNLSLP